MSVSTHVLLAHNDYWSNLHLVLVRVLSEAQIDLVEKRQQVNIIGNIFAQAMAVLVWLGEHDDTPRAVFQLQKPLSTMPWNRDGTL